MQAVTPAGSTRRVAAAAGGPAPPLGGAQILTPQALLALYRPDLAECLETLQLPAYRYDQVCEHLFRRPDTPFSEATSLPRDVRVVLDKLGTSLLTTVAAQTAPDGTTKLLLRTPDRLCLETVIMRYRDRVTLCLSSQIGCPVGCRFCATGAMGFRRNLTAAEIVDQVRTASALVAAEGRRVSNLVYMGMGEPLLNLQAVLTSIRIATSPHGLALAHRSVSVSTIGVPRGMLHLARTEPQVNLALSLHAADDQTRALLVPERFRHPVAQILEAAWEHFALTHRKLLVEYILIRGINDSIADARRLAGLLRGHVVTVNLLAWNDISFSTEASLPKNKPPNGQLDRAGATVHSSLFLQPSSHPATLAFRDTLLAAGVETVIRRSKGTAIQAACGQLAATHPY